MRQSSSNIRLLLGQRIRSLRRLRGLTQAELADLTKKTARTISNLEGGRAGAPIETLQSIADKLNVELRDLFEGVTPRRRKNDDRVEAENRIIDFIRRLDDERLKIAAVQIEALLKKKPDSSRA